jgi:hypothetical protein
VGSGGTKHITPLVTGKAPITDITLQPLPIIIIGNGHYHNACYQSEFKKSKYLVLFYFIHACIHTSIQLHTHA